MFVSLYRSPFLKTACCSWQNLSWGFQKSIDKFHTINHKSILIYFSKFCVLQPKSKMWFLQFFFNMAAKLSTSLILPKSSTPKIGKGIKIQQDLVMLKVSAFLFMIKNSIALFNFHTLINSAIALIHCWNSYGLYANCR